MKNWKCLAELFEQVWNLLNCAGGHLMNCASMPNKSMQEISCVEGIEHSLAYIPSDYATRIAKKSIQLSQKIFYHIDCERY